MYSDLEEDGYPGRRTVRAESPPRGGYSPRESPTGKCLAESYCRRSFKALQPVPPAASASCKTIKRDRSPLFKEYFVWFGSFVVASSPSSFPFLAAKEGESLREYARETSRKFPGSCFLSSRCCGSGSSLNDITGQTTSSVSLCHSLGVP